MKISARTCNTSVETKKPEPDLEFYLDENTDSVYLRVRDKNNHSVATNYILAIGKSDGKIRRINSINRDFGLPLDSSGRLKLITED